jgi:hypothetical protein
MTFRIPAQHLVVLLVIAANGHSVVAQAPPITAPAASIAVRIAMEKDQIPVGQSPIATLTIWNTSNHTVSVAGFRDDYQFHVRDEDGELEVKKSWMDRFLMGGSTVEPASITLFPAGWAGDSADIKFALSDRYKFDIPGRYSVYTEVEDPSGTMLRTNTAQFEIAASAH